MRNRTGAYSGMPSIFVYAVLNISNKHRYLICS